MSVDVDLFSFAPAYSPSMGKADRSFITGVPLPNHETTLQEDIGYIFLASYFMTKAALKGFAIVSIPFWFATMGLLSLMS